MPTAAPTPSSAPAAGPAGPSSQSQQQQADGGLPAAAAASADGGGLAGVREWWADYPAPGSTFYDELKGGSGRLRAPWSALAGALGALPAAEWVRRAGHLRELIEEAGITYNVYSDPLGARRPWELDLLPLPLGQREWARLEAAVKQRARLLELIARDLYGPQKLVRDGRLPPALVYLNPGFLRPCAGWKPPGGLHLHVVGADIARAPDGSWWVLRDRADAPSGAGYALQNRAILARVLREPFAAQRLRRVLPFFEQWRRNLEACVTRRTDEPVLGVLTPGPANETYHEHSFLARHLGVPLVEGGDLSVRDGRVFLKTLEGLRPVDVLLRRVDSDFCDPLELRPESLLGAAGLLGAARLGRCVPANALGAGVLEAPALLAFLAPLCKHLLGEELRLPSVATWWCGHARERRYVLENLPQLVLRPAFRGLGRPTHFGPSLDAAELARVRARVEAEPEAWCGQELVSVGHAPVWHGGSVVPRQYLLRTFATLAPNATPTVLPGGLARVSDRAGDRLVSMQDGGGSKDVWVEAPAGEDEPPPPPVLPSAETARPVPLRLAGLSSRAADHLFWLGRYLARADTLVRRLRQFCQLLTDESLERDAAVLRPFLGLVLSPAELPAAGASAGVVWAALAPLAAGRRHPGAVAGALAAVVRAAQPVRDRLPGDAAAILSQFDALARGRPDDPDEAPPGPEDALSALQELALAFNALDGLLLLHMTRGDSYRFVQLGRQLEQLLQTTYLLGAAYADGAPGRERLHLLLALLDVFNAYRRLYAVPHPLAVLDYCVQEPANPAGLLHHAREVAALVEALPRPPAPEPADGLARQAFQLLSHIRLAQPAALLAGANGSVPALDDFLGRAREIGFGVSDALSLRYFALSELPGGA